jgi:hypothetical protein
MSIAQQFFARFLVAAVITGMISYGVTAFIVYDLNPAHWAIGDRAGAAVSWICIGGMFSLCAGVSAVKN